MGRWRLLQGLIRPSRRRRQPDPTPEPDPIPEPQPDLAPAPATSNLFDFTQLPPATLQVRIASGRGAGEAYTVSLNEDNGTATIEFVRNRVAEEMTLRLEEVGYSGNRSPPLSGLQAESARAPDQARQS